MAVETVKSTAITNRDSSPRALSNPSLIKGMLVEAVGMAAVDSAASIGSKYLLATVPSNARLSNLLLSCTAITSAAGDIGVYKSTAEGGAVVDADFFASAQSLATALANSDVTHESAVFGVDDVEKPLWEALGLTEDPGIMYDIVVTLTAAATAAGTVAMKARYVI